MARMKPDLSQKNRRIFTLLSDYATSDCRQLLRPTVWIRRSSCLRTPPVSPNSGPWCSFSGKHRPEVANLVSLINRREPLLVLKLVG
jgi:hypothetical protein